MVSFGNFIAEKYNSKSDQMKKVYGSKDDFKRLYVANYGLKPWLETLRGRSISLGLTNNIAKALIEECRRIPEDLPGDLSSIARQFDLELPVVEGLLTKDYWQGKVEQLHWNQRRAA